MREDFTKINNTTYSLEKIFPEAKDFLPLLGTDYVEFYVGNAKQAAHFYKTALGFQSIAYAGLETGIKDRTSYVVVQDKIRLVLLLLSQEIIMRYLNIFKSMVMELKLLRFGWTMQLKLGKRQQVGS